MVIGCVSLWHAAAAATKSSNMGQQQQQQGHIVRDGG
jgi:hypothetical protein